MNRYRSVFFGFLLILLFVKPHLPAAQHSFDSQKLDSFLSALEEYNKFMGSVAILEGDEVLFQQAYGFKDTNEQPADINTIYRIGSITKPYTSTMILQLVEDGDLKLTDTLDQFFPDIPNANTITIEHLLYHRSGLVNVTSVDQYMDYYTEGTTQEEMINRIIEYGTNFEPGEQMEYSNTGYLLLGYIIEEVTGMDYAGALKAMIAEPLGLVKTYYGMDISSVREEAQSFSFGESGWELSSETDMSVPHGAGAIVSTPAEVGLFLNALFNGELVSMESLEKMKNLKDGYGYGIFRFPFNSRFAWGHNGGIDAFQSTSGHFPEENLTFVLIGNGVNYSLNDIAIGILSILFDQGFEIPDFSNDPEPVELTESELQSFTGYYTSDDIPLEVELFIEAGVLYAKATGQGAFPLSSFEGGIMKFNPAGITMVFNDRLDGNYQGFELQQGGQFYQFTQKEE